MFHAATTMPPFLPNLAPTLAELGISSESLAARGLCEYPEAQCLEIAETDPDGRIHQLEPGAAAAWRALKAAAADDGIALVIVSAFRSVERQADIIRRKLDAGMGIEEILGVCAPPGFSEHHTGRAVDISTPGSPPLEVSFDDTPAYAWLDNHAATFGFRLSYPAGNAWGYQYEPWHWCFDATQSGIDPAPHSKE